MRLPVPWTSADPSAPLMPRALAAVAAVAIAAAGAVSPARAAESQDACTAFITALPAVIGSGGTWCLQGPLTVTDEQAQWAISIAARNVVLDCNGHRLRSGFPVATTPHWGIVGFAAGLANITVRNCQLSGFGHGLFIYGDAVVLEDNRILDSRDRGIYLQGQDGVVRRNHVAGVGADTGSQQYSLFGISVFGNIDVIDNVVARVVATPGTEDRAYGIFKNDDELVPTASVISGNRVRDLRPDVNAEGAGIVLAGMGAAVVRDNIVWGGPGQIGIYCWYTTPTRVTDNVVHAAIPIYHCVSDGGNIEKP